MRSDYGTLLGMGVHKHQISLLAALWLTAFSACSSTDGLTCLTSKDCLGGETCVANICQSTATEPKMKCSQNSDCASGEYCDQTSGQCTVLEVTSCDEDIDCPPHQRCQLSLSVCVDGSRSCVDDSTCSGYFCDTAANTCVPCLNNAHCPSGQECVASQCIDASIPRCSVDAECLPPQTICENSICSAGCSFPGGLSCQVGTTCNESTGRCDPNANTCTDDAQCGAPQSICINGACTPGCDSFGGLMCTSNEVCDTNTGRCIVIPPPCGSDAECAPPLTVCESGQCVGGCNQTGGIACTGGFMCNAATGRCDPPTGGPMCTSDAQCNAPTTICDLNSGNCTPGCLSIACAQGQMCNQTTGHCEAQTTNPPTGGAQLDASCTVNTDCASSSCFDFGASLGKRCVQGCGASADCPLNYTCYNYTGAKMCISSALYTQATTVNVSFAGAPGSACLDFGQCKSGFCPQNINMCVETCSENSDCGGGYCRWNQAETYTFIASCDGPQGSYPEGTACTLDSQCASGACVGSAATGVFQCARLCGSSSTCTSGEICRMVDYTLCSDEFLGICYQYQPNLVQTCVTGQHGTDPVGSSCTSGTSCRSGYCDTSIGTCTDLCSGDADCASNYRCKVLSGGTLVDGVTPAYINVCMPPSYN
jgi:hypothetical protein